jgi:hypothetical protein
LSSVIEEFRRRLGDTSRLHSRHPDRLVAERRKAESLGVRSRGNIGNAPAADLASQIIAAGEARRRPIQPAPPPAGSLAEKILAAAAEARGERK